MRSRDDGRARRIERWSAGIGAFSNDDECDADVAQLVELLICNQQVAGSSPAVGSRIP
jgi:hypothetical protein